MEKKLEAYGESIYPNAYLSVMRKKLGLELVLDSDAKLIEELIGTLQDAQVDYTEFFRTLSHYDGDMMPLLVLAMNPVVIEEWLTLYDKRLVKETQSQEERHSKMLQTNPKYILKNYMLEKAITLAKVGDFSMLETLMYLAQHPFDELPEYEEFAGETPEGYKNITLSCSS